MPTSKTAWKRLWIGLGSGAFVIVAALNGCGGSSDPIEIPEAAKKFLSKKKADYEDRSTKAQRTVPSNPKIPTTSPRP